MAKGTKKQEALSVNRLINEVLVSYWRYVLIFLKEKYKIDV